MLFTWEATPERAKEGIGKNDGEGIQANKGDVKELVTLTGYGLSPLVPFQESLRNVP